VRDRRIENEWRLLNELADANPGIVRILERQTTPEGDLFHIVLHQTGGLIGTAPDLRLATSHQVRFRYPEYFPAAPLEAFLKIPVYHPNVHPEMGFVCLWSEASPRDTVCEAVPKLRQIVSWRLMNPASDHLMQPEALANPPAMPLPLPCAPLTVPAWREAPPGMRRRLSRI